MRIFAHEFAHALEREMERFDPDFYNKQVEIVEAEKERLKAQGIDVSRLSSQWYSPREYWAYAVEDWFYNLIDNPDTYEVPGWSEHSLIEPFIPSWTEPDTYPDNFVSSIGIGNMYTYDRYKELHPLLYELLSEWFPKVTLRDYTYCELDLPEYEYNCFEILRSFYE